MTTWLILGYVPLMIVLLCVGMYASAMRRDNAAHALGEQLRRSGVDRRSPNPMPFVGVNRRSGVDRRQPMAARERSERAA